MILFSVYDGGVKLVGEPRLAESLETAKLSLGRFFADNESMRNRMESVKLAYFGVWDPSHGLVSLRPVHYSAVDCYEEYLKEVQKQNEEAVSNSDGSV